MKKYILLVIMLILGIILAAVNLQAQTSHNVSVANFEFSPSHLDINVGDMVVWTNSSGQHNVNGTNATFPDNPDSFGNSPGPAGWSYTFVFTTPGDYSYRCDIHPATMFGSITVTGTPVSVDERIKPGYFEFYPNPVSNELHWKWNRNSTPTDAHIQIYDVTGKLTDSFQLGFESHKDVSNWTEGMYIYTITTENQPVQTGKLFILK